MFLGAFAVAIATQLLSSAAAAPQAQAGSCAAIERRMLAYVLDEKNFAAFRQVAAHRRAAKLDVLPSFPFCGSLTGAVVELRDDKRTTALLRRGGMSESDYVVAGWSLIVASNPDAFSVGTAAQSKTLQRNVAFAKRHGPEIRTLLSGE